METLTIEEARKVKTNILEKGKEMAQELGFKSENDIEKFSIEYLQGELEMILVFGPQYAVFNFS